MASRSAGANDAPLVVIVGETGSGKTALAIELAKRFNGEIICADSRTVYRGMDIGTAKPTVNERAGIPHYGLDVVEPGQQFTAYDFQQLALKAIEDISGRGKLSIIVGGTGLYVDSVIYGFAFRPAPSAETRAKYASLSVAELQAALTAAGMELPPNESNRRHLTRLLESGLPPKQPRTLRPRTMLLGLRLPSEQLEERIVRRVDAMFRAGLVDEVRSLTERYGRDAEALRAPGYRAAAALLRGEIDLSEARRLFARDDLRLAKRQRTWFRRNPDIHWLTNWDNLAKVVDLVTTFLS